MCKRPWRAEPSAHVFGDLLRCGGVSDRPPPSEGEVAGRPPAAAACLKSGARERAEDPRSGEGEVMGRPPGVVGVFSNARFGVVGVTNDSRLLDFIGFGDVDFGDVGSPNAFLGDVGDFGDLGASDSSVSTIRHRLAGGVRKTGVLGLDLF